MRLKRHVDFNHSISVMVFIIITVWNVQWTTCLLKVIFCIIINKDNRIKLLQTALIRFNNVFTMKYKLSQMIMQIHYINSLNQYFQFTVFILINIGIICFPKMFLQNANEYINVK